MIELLGSRKRAKHLQAQLEKNNPLLEEAASKIDALEALITKARDALLALRLANENAPTLSLWQQRANANADAVLQAIERHEPANV